MAELAERYRTVRARTEALTEGLTPDDMQAQAMPEASPAKWHLGHTTWFFETFVLSGAAPGYRPFHPAFRMLFNSYYDAVGERPPRPNRGQLTRPALPEVLAWRRAVDEAMLALCERIGQARSPDLVRLIELGLAHEEQHQELMETDLLALAAMNPLEPAFRPSAASPPAIARPLRWLALEAGLREIGHSGPGFAFDNETPRHAVLVGSYRLASRPVSCGEWLQFMADNGYGRPGLWQQEGFETARARGWKAPGYWEWRDGAWTVMTLAGRRPVDEAAPVAHVSWWEADAFARWADARLPTEQEWEVANPPAAGMVWEWTGSAHRPHPGWRRPAGAFGEYNGKFMANTMVLKGGSHASPPGHVRPSYRNFFEPSARWQFSGLRLAADR